MNAENKIKNIIEDLLSSVDPNAVEFDFKYRIEGDSIYTTISNTENVSISKLDELVYLYYNKIPGFPTKLKKSQVQDMPTALKEGSIFGMDPKFTALKPLIVNSVPGLLLQRFIEDSSGYKFADVLRGKVEAREDDVLSSEYLKHFFTFTKDENTIVVSLVNILHRYLKANPISDLPTKEFNRIVACCYILFIVSEECVIPLLPLMDVGLPEIMEYDFHGFKIQTGKEFIEKIPELHVRLDSLDSPSIEDCLPIIMELHSVETIKNENKDVEDLLISPEQETPMQISKTTTTLKDLLDIDSDVVSILRERGLMQKLENKLGKVSETCEKLMQEYYCSLTSTLTPAVLEFKTAISPLSGLSAKQNAYSEAIACKDYMAVADCALELSEFDTHLADVDKGVEKLIENLILNTEEPSSLATYIETSAKDDLESELVDANLKIEDLKSKLQSCYSKVDRYKESNTPVVVNDLILDCLEGKADNLKVIQGVKSLFPDVVFLEASYYNGIYKSPQKLLTNLIRLCGKYFNAITGGESDSTAKDILGNVYRANESKTTMGISEMARERAFEVERNGIVDTFYFEQHLTLGTRRGEPYTIQVHFKILEGVLYIGRIGPHLKVSSK